MSWRNRAACIGADGLIFFPHDRKFSAKTWAEAREFCAGCTVREQCLAFALSHDATEDRWGMFGGMTPTERKAHRRRLVKES